MKSAVVYVSKGGNTEKLARAVVVDNRVMVYGSGGKIYGNAVTVRNPPRGRIFPPIRGIYESMRV
jgi:hypothetical protein